MEQKFNTSFIPKKSLQADTSSTAARDKYVKRRTSYGPGFFLSLLVFIAVVVTSLGIFMYTTIVDKRIEDYKDTLADIENNFDVFVIDDLIRTDNRITYAKSLLMNHVVLSELFKKLENVTSQKIQYTEFLYAGATEEQVNPVMTLSGTSREYKDVAQQTTAYRDDLYLNNPIMLELGRDHSTDAITFALEVVLDKNLTSFSTALGENRYGTVRSAPQIPVVEAPPVTTDANATST